MIENGDMKAVDWEKYQFQIIIYNDVSLSFYSCSLVIFEMIDFNLWFNLIMKNPLSLLGVSIWLGMLWREFLALFDCHMWFVSSEIFMD